MFIQTEATPNPATLKFIPGKPVLADGTADFTDKSEALASPLATRLFEIDGVRGVFLGSDFISVTKGDVEWQHLKPMVLGAIMEHYVSGAPVVAEETANDAAGGSFDPKDQAVVDTIKELLETRVRPAVAQDGGDITFSGLPRRHRLSAHARRLLGLPELDRHAAPRHREPAPALLPRGGGGAGRLRPAYNLQTYGTPPLRRGFSFASDHLSLQPARSPHVRGHRRKLHCGSFSSTRARTTSGRTRTSPTACCARSSTC